MEIKSRTNLLWQDPLLRNLFRYHSLLWLLDCEAHAPLKQKRIYWFFCLLMSHVRHVICILCNVYLFGTNYTFLHVRFRLWSQNKENIMLVYQNDVTIKRLCLSKDLSKNYIPSSNYIISDVVHEMLIPPNPSVVYFLWQKQALRCRTWGGRKKFNNWWLTFT